MWTTPSILYFILILKSCICCDCCHKNKEYKIKKYSINDIISKNNDAKYITVGKRQLEFEEELMIDQVMETSTLNAKSVTSDTTINPTSETSTYLDTGTTGTNNEEGEIKKCTHYNKGAEFDLNIMADVWENAYYQMKQTLTCFRIHLKLMTIQEQKYYERIYGNFSNAVAWDKCLLQVKAGLKNNAETKKKHFLQGTATDEGVMDNIIIVEDYDDKTTTITLRKENPDQWLVFKDLLLMRDCNDGDIVVFTRVPFQPRREDIIDALAIFGEEKANGTFGCAGDHARSTTFTNVDDGDDNMFQ